MNRIIFFAGSSQNQSIKLPSFLRKSKKAAMEKLIENKITNTEQAAPNIFPGYEMVRDMYYPERVFVAPKYQQQGRYVKESNAFVEQRFDANSAISAMFTTETVIVQKLNFGVCQNLDKLFIRMNVTVSSASVELAPTPYWFKNIDIYNTAGHKIQVLRPEEIMFKLNQISRENTRNAYKELCHFGDSGVSWKSPTAVQQLLSGETRDFYLPLSCVLDSANLNFRYIKNWVEFRFTTRSNIVESGSGTVSVNSIHFVIQERNLTPEAETTYKVLSSNAIRYNYLDCHRVATVSTTALVSGTEYSINLSSVPRCFSPFILMTMRQSSSIDDSVASGAAQQYIPIGPAGKIMLRQGSNNVMEVSGGVNTDLLYRTLSQQYLEGDLLQKMPMYLISFADSVTGPSIGRFTHGYFKFDGNANQSLVIQPVSGTSAVQTITSAATVAPDGGQYRLFYNGHLTSNIAFDATAATIKAALEALPSFKAENLTVTVTQAFSVAGTLVLTFAARCGNPKYLVQMIPDSVNDGGVACNPVTALTTRGVAGIVSSQTHVIDLFIFYYRELYTQNGELADITVADKA